MRTIVVGAGAAGLWCALRSAERGPVHVIAPHDRSRSATDWAQGGIASAVGPDDSPAQHAADTLGAGDGLCDPEAVGILARDAPGVIAALTALGMRFDDASSPGLEGGHAARRVLHAGGDASGRALLGFLVDRIDGEERVDRIAGSASAIAVEHGRAAGVTLEDGTELAADRVVLATGGACGIFGRRTGPDQATGDGIAMAWDAGAVLADLEFVQFHPTALDVRGQPARLLTEALRGEGAVLIDADGQPFVERFDPRGSLAPRDVVARAIHRIARDQGVPVRLDATRVIDLIRRFPTAVAACRAAGLDLASEPVPVSPAPHYFTGGVRTDTNGRSSVPGLLACGEVACTGVHGANRLASNSLAEALVFGERAAEADDDAAAFSAAGKRRQLAGAPPAAGAPLERVRGLADELLGVERSGDGLRACLARLPANGAREGNRSATLVAWLLAQAALRREESRGGHLRADFPEHDPRWRVRQLVDRDGWWTAPVPQAEPAATTGA
ncbi:MAG: FAD-binding protein [Actinomycetota bacterium]